jgi:hypothetical protein
MKQFSTWSTSIHFGLFILFSGCRQKNQTGMSSSPSSGADSGQVSIAKIPAHTESNTVIQSGLPKPAEEERVQEEVKRVREKLKKELETARLSIFSVPLSDAAARDRQEAWDRIAPPPRGFLNNGHYQYACDILDRYSDAPPLEKLAFWRLISIRIYYQSETGIVRGFGGSGVGRQKIDEKLKTTLYSVLGQSPEVLPLREATSEGYALLEQLAAESLQN